MQFPVSGVVVSPWLPSLVAFGISFLTSMGGVSGAFLLLPFQMSVLGYTQPSVSATNHVFNIIAIPAGAYRYYKEGRMIWPLTWTVVLGTLPGVCLGPLVRVNSLQDPRNFKLFAGLVILHIAGKMIHDLLDPPLQLLAQYTTIQVQGM
nr:sulfite exporter TauE/SafE family protein [uncultured Desulfobulbus sp.]